jgi:hypothetical protein
VNLLSPLPDARAAEQVATLLTRPGLRVERIVSLGQASPPGFRYDQAEGEWVLVVAGAAKLRFADEPEARLLRPRRLARYRPAPTPSRRLDRPGNPDRMARGVL